MHDEAEKGDIGALVPWNIGRIVQPDPEVLVSTVQRATWRWGLFELLKRGSSIIWGPSTPCVRGRGKNHVHGFSRM